jgi:putative membrane protein
MADQGETNRGFLDGLKSLLGITVQAPEPTTAPMDLSTKLSYDRTFLAYERTLMAWVRTSSSLITFGFSIYKFFQIEHGMGKEFASAQIIGPRHFSMILIVIGVVALVLATIQHRRQLEMLKLEYKNAPASTAGIVAGLISIMGLLAILAVIFRL